MANFTFDMSKFANKSIGEIEQVVRKTAIDLSTAIIKDTAIDSGRLRANWFVSFETPNTGTTDSTNASKAIADATSTIATNKIGKYIYIQNNLDYAAKIEYGGSAQNNRMGMVRVNVERFATRS